MQLTPWFLNFDFTRRARRSHMWANWVAWIVILIVFAFVGTATQNAPGASGIAPVLLFGIMVGSGVDAAAMVFRRAHDTGRSGWIWPLLIIPFVNFLPLYWLFIQDSDQGPNKYGPPVKDFYVPPPA